jgi:transposase
MLHLRHCRSRDGTFNLADCGCGALHQAAWNVDHQSSGKSRCNEKGLAGVRDNASTRQRFRGMLGSKSVGKLGAWLRDAQKSGLYAMQRFARTAQRDIDAVRNAITEPWSNGQTEGQINRLKALKRTMYGRAGPELLRARLLPV